MISLRTRRTWCWLIGAFALWGSGAAQAQLLFVERTDQLFPQPNLAEYTNQLSIVDIDLDDDLDIVFANGGNFSSPGTPLKARVYINDGTGHFTDETDARTGGVTGHFRGVEFGDVDGDGDPDMALANDFAELPRLLVNDGAGFFTDESERLPALALGSPRVQFADIDNDGDLDLYFANGGASRFGCGQNRLYVNDGNGFFTDETEARHPIENVCEPMDCNFGDIDGDFDLDIRTGSTAFNQSRLYRNDGTGVFTTVSGVPTDQNCYSYEFGDIEDDGDLDLFGANANPSGNNSDLLLINDGTGAFVDGSSRLMPNPAVDDNDSKFFDYDMDGDLDLIVARLFGTAERIYNNDGTGIFSEVTGLITENSDASLDIKVADVTGDARFDIVTAQGESGNFENRIYVCNSNCPMDSIAPTIVRTEVLADTTDTEGPYLVRATVADQVTSDRNFFDRGISINFRVNDGQLQTVDMIWSGGQVYRGAIPGQPDGGVVDYFVTARDDAGNQGSGDLLTFEVIAPDTCDGDANGDDTVDPLDVGFVQARLGCSVGTGDPECDAADVNADLAVDPLDVGYVQARLGLCE